MSGQAVTKSLALPGELTTTGYVPPDDLNFDGWKQVGEHLGYYEGAVQWWIGDWLRFGARKYGETYAEAIKITGSEYETLKAAKWVADSFSELVRRRTNLSWSHHREVVSLEPEVADRLLDQAEHDGWTRAELRRRVSQAKTAARLLTSPTSETTCGIVDLHRLVEEGRKFATIYADPPWLYDNQGTRAATGNHYGGMAVDELCELPIKELAADDAHLHLWTTNGFIFECPRLIEAWGFEFKSTFTWCKPQIGIGNYWRNAHEILLTCVRGDAKRFNDRSLRSWIECDRGEHSGKPEQVRAMVEKASPGPRLELFARREAAGWAVWGNQIERSLFDESVRAVA